MSWNPFGIPWISVGSPVLHDSYCDVLYHHYYCDYHVHYHDYHYCCYYLEFLGCPLEFMYCTVPTVMYYDLECFGIRLELLGVKGSMVCKRLFFGIAYSTHVGVDEALSPQAFPACWRR